MNATSRLFAFAALNLAAGVAAVAAPAAQPLSWDCARSGVPTHAEVREHFGIRDADRAHDAALRTRLVAQRACAAGVDRVQLVLRDGAPAEATMVAIAAR
jgi:hypothetical protein